MEKKRKKIIRPVSDRFSLPAILAAVTGTVQIAWLFYDHVWGMIPGSVAGIYIGSVVVRMSRERRQRTSREQFRRLLLSVETALEAGYSLENAFDVAEGDLALIYNRGEEISALVGEIRRKIKLQIPVWRALEEYAAVVRIEEAEEFATVLRIQQRTGGDLIRTIRQAAVRLQESLELRQEVESTLFEKRLEQRIMVVMPSLMLLYMRIMNRTYIEPLYQGIGGVVIMTMALAGNIAADRIAAKILEKAMPLGTFGYDRKNDRKMIGERLRNDRERSGSMTE